jgi:N-dimethylarginine dimethylaminohydrolase
MASFAEFDCRAREHVVEKIGTDSKQPGHKDRSESQPRLVSHVLMARPDYFEIVEAKNPFSREDTFVDLPRAIRQWDNLREVFQRVGLDVLLLEPVSGLADMCFAANQAFVGIDREERSFAIPSRMLHRSRRDEVEHFACWYSQQGYRIVDLALEGEEFLEGAGDLLWNPDGESIWAGFGHRSTGGAVDQFAALMKSMGFEVRKLELVDPHFYHLSLCLAPLNSDALLIYPGAFAPETLVSIRQCARSYEVTREEALQFVCNGVAVNGYYITPRLSHRLEKILSREAIEPIVVNLSEFEKAGGSVSSLKMLLP